MYTPTLEGTHVQSSLRRMRCYGGETHAEQASAYAAYLAERQNAVRKGSSEWNMVARERDFIVAVSTSKAGVLEALLEEIDAYGSQDFLVNAQALDASLRRAGTQAERPDWRLLRWMIHYEEAVRHELRFLGRIGKRIEAVMPLRRIH